MQVIDCTDECLQDIHALSAHELTQRRIRSRILTSWVEHGACSEDACQWSISYTSSLLDSTTYICIMYNFTFDDRVYYARDKGSEDQ